VIVADDCAIPPPLEMVGRRGLAGTILVHKVHPQSYFCSFTLCLVLLRIMHFIISRDFLEN